MAMDQETLDPPSWLGGVMGGACLAPLAGGRISVSTGREDRAERRAVGWTLY